MSRADRRHALALMVLSGLAMALPGEGARAWQGHLIAPPPGPMRFTRRLTRALVDGAQLVVERGFIISFARFADGFIIEGRQQWVEVSAPAALAGFATLERARDESALFPLVLDPFGRLQADAAGPLPEWGIAEAIEQAEQAVRQQPLVASEQASLRQLLATFHDAGSRVVAQMPADLFAPSGAERVEERSLALPGGLTGRVAIRFRGQCDQASGLMREAWREVSTIIGDDRREAREDWSLAPDAG